jgi:zinc/manganese transport system permease protein
MMMLPATAARFWASSLSALMAVSTVIATLSGLIGLIVSYHAGVASGPAIVLTASAFYGVSVLFGRTGILRKLFPKPHLAH